SRYFNLQVSRADVKAVWSGLRPLVSDPKATDTAKLARDHVIEDSKDGLLTIAGGKWTTYRKMALDTVDHALKLFKLAAPKPTCQTEQLPIMGSADYKEKGDLELSNKYGFDPDIAAYLNRTYGDQASKVAELTLDGNGARLVENHPVLEAEVLYAARYELAERVIDVLARRMPLALLDTEAAKQAAARVQEIMATELGWDQQRCDAEAEWTKKRLTEAL
ncbi:MAG: glycerol-3-phosphate dehydrogenase, partial [Desulfuromusa sp.]|nr:glycerol-3-phosphate dehydrogenase [Desulfuromusa sp.]